MAEASMEVGLSVAGEVEFKVGDKTAAWLVSIGWTPPVEKSEEQSGEDLVEAKPISPSAGLREARIALNGRQAAQIEMQNQYKGIKAEMSSPDDLDKLLAFFGVNVPRFLRDVVSDAAAQL